MVSPIDVNVFLDRLMTIIRLLKTEDMEGTLEKNFREMKNLSGTYIG